MYGDLVSEKSPEKGILLAAADSAKACVHPFSKWRNWVYEGQMASDNHTDTKSAHQEDWCDYLSAFKFKILSFPLHGLPVPHLWFLQEVNKK